MTDSHKNWSRSSGYTMREMIGAVLNTLEVPAHCKHAFPNIDATTHDGKWLGAFHKASNASVWARTQANGKAYVEVTIKLKGKQEIFYSYNEFMGDTMATVVGMIGQWVLDNRVPETIEVHGRTYRLES